MPKITLDEFCSHWVSRTSTRVMASRLEFNVFDFATAVAMRLTASVRDEDDQWWRDF